MKILFFPLLLLLSLPLRPLHAADLPVNVFGIQADLQLNAIGAGESGQDIDDWVDVGVSLSIPVLSVPNMSSIAPPIAVFPVGSLFFYGDMSVLVDAPNAAEFPYSWSLDLNNIDFGALGTGGVSLVGSYDYVDSNTVNWNLDSVTPMIFGLNNEYTLTVVGAAPSSNTRNVNTTLALGSGSVHELKLVFQISEMAVPEPDTYLILGSLLALGLLGKRRAVA